MTGPEEGLPRVGDALDGRQRPFGLWHDRARRPVEITDTWEMTITPVPGLQTAPIALDLPAKSGLAARLIRAEG